MDGKQMVTTSGRLSTTFNKYKVVYISSLVDVDALYLGMQNEMCGCNSFSFQLASVVLIML